MNDESLKQEMSQPSEGQQSGEEAVDARREAEMRYRTDADFAYDWEVWQAPDGSLRYVSPSCERITGYPAKAFLDNPHLTDELILPQDRDAWREHRRAIEARVPQEIHFRIRRPDGEIRWIEHVCQPVSDDQGTFLGHRASNRDVTARKRIEEELAAHREHLEELVAARSDELANINAELRNEISARQRAEEALQRSEERYRRIVEGSPDLIYVYSAKQGAQYWSPRVEEVLGYSPSLLRDDPFIWHDSIHPDDLPAVDAVINGSERSKGFDIEYRIRSANGNWLWLRDRHISVQRVEDDLIIEGIATDITERKQAEVALKRGEERYALAQRAANIGSWDWDIISGELYWSEQIEPMFGFEPGQFGATYEAFLESVHPQDRQFVMDAVDASVETGVDYAIEHRIVWPDGTVRWVSETGDVIREESGQAIRMLGIVQDITARKAADEALRESEEQFRTVAEQSPNMVFINVRGRIVYANRRCEEMLGYARQEFCAPSFDFLDLIAPEYRTLLMENFRAHLRGEEVPSYEYTLVTKDGQRIDAIISPKLIRYGGESAILGTVTDITGRKRVERALRTSQQFLQSTLDSLAGNIAILDAEGTILAVNASWRHFAEANDLAWPDYGVGRNYLAVVDASVEDLGGAGAVAAGIRAVIAGERAQYSTEYPCHSPDQQHWFVMRVTRFESGEGPRVVTLHEDITERKRSEEARARLAAIVESSEDAIIGKSLEGTILSWNNGAERIYGYSAAEVVGRSISLLLPPDRPNEVLQILDRIKKGEPVTLFETERVTKGGKTIHVALNISPILDEAGRLIGASTIARDITARIRSEQALRQAKEDAEQAKREEEVRRQEAERRRRIAESLRDVLGVLNSDRSLDAVLNHIAGQAGQLLGTRAAGIFSLDTETGKLSVRAARGLLITYMAGARVPVGLGALQQVTASRQPVAVPDLAEAADHGREVALSPAWSRIYRALLAVPILVQDAVYGGMLLYYAEPRTFSDEEIDLAVAFGDQVALAIENARLREQVKVTAATTERESLARDLHDAVTQTLFSASLIAEAMPRVWEQSPEAGRRGLEELRWLTRGAAAEMRTMLVELRPAALTEKPLGELLRHLTEAMTGRTRVPMSLSLDGNCRLLPDVQIALYRIVQEALNNVAKHASASQVSVDLFCRPERAVLTIVDDGVGFDPDEILPDRLGLGTMRERAQGIGATIRIDSQPGQGTQLLVTWRDRRRE